MAFGSSRAMRALGRPGSITAAFYIACALLAIAMGELTHYINSLPYAVMQAGDPGASALSKAQDSFVALNSLLTTLATGLLAGLGWFLTSGPKRNTARPIWPAAISALCVCVSLYWGYIASQNAEFAIEYSVQSLDFPLIQLPSRLQFYSLLIGVIFFADFVRRDLTKEDRHESSASAAHA